MNFLEKDLEEIIFTADREILNRRELYISGKLKRQLKIGNYGVADLVEYNRPYYHPQYNQVFKGEICVYELKKENVSVSSFLQAIGYLQGIKNYLSNRGIADNYNYSIKLIGKKIDYNSTFIFLDRILSFSNDMIPIENESGFNLTLFTYTYEADGIYFYPNMTSKLKNEGF